MRDQLYPHWQLCIVDDASTLPHVRPLLKAAAAADPRIRLVLRDSRGHICVATRTALTLAEGEFVTFLDHDDELAPLALAHVAVEIARHPEADLLYSDEDLIGTDSRRYDPYFKPDWNRELLRAQNYLCHLSVYRADLLRELDAFRPEVQGSQDWDLALRASERARCIRHLPHVLYHWRTVPGSTARADTAKHYSQEAGRRAVEDHLVRCREQAEVELLPFGHLHVRHPLPNPRPRISLIIARTLQRRRHGVSASIAAEHGLSRYRIAGGNITCGRRGNSAIRHPYRLRRTRRGCGTSQPSSIGGERRHTLLCEWRLPSTGC